MITVAAELSTDHERIAVVTAGVLAMEQTEFVAGQLQALTPLLSPSDPPGGVVLPASWPAVVQLATLPKIDVVKGPRLREWIAVESVARRDAGTSVAVPDPPTDRTPRDYQRSGAALIAELGRVLITDEPGTGKTATTILGLLARSAHVTAFPVVVVCPASVVDAWVTEWQGWAPGVRVVAWRGAPARRRRLVGQADVYVTSYDLVIRDAAAKMRGRGRPLLDVAAASVVVDECHFVKNHQAARTQAVQRLASGLDTVVALSGTPITHSPADLWPTLTCLAPGAWPSRERWVNRYCLAVPSDYGEKIIGLDPAREDEFRLALWGQQRRVAKADVLAQLPPKQYGLRSVELPTAWRRAYDEMERFMIANLPDDGGALPVMSALAQLTRLSQLASAAADVAVEWVYDELLGIERPHYHVTLKAPSWKVDALLDVLAERPGDPVVAFAPSRQLVVLAGELAATAGYRVGFITGGQTASERSAQVAAFQAGELDLMCATTGAGGVGLTLTAAGTVVFLQRPWSLVEATQAEDRCHRIGSERHDSIEIIDITAVSTIDTRVRAVLRERAGQLADLVQDPRIVTELLGGDQVERKKVA